MMHPYRWLRLLPLVGVMSLIFYLSHLPGENLHLPEIVNVDKALHCLAYATLGVASIFSLAPHWRRSHPRLLAVSVPLFCLLYGFSDEFHQSFIPGRSVSGADLVADFAGGLLAVFVSAAWQRFGPQISRG